MTHAQMLVFMTWALLSGRPAACCCFGHKCSSDPPEVTRYILIVRLVYMYMGLTCCEAALAAGRLRSCSQSPTMQHSKQYQHASLQSL